MTMSEMSTSNASRSTRSRARSASGTCTTSNPSDSRMISSSSAWVALSSTTRMRVMDCPPTPRTSLAARRPRPGEPFARLAGEQQQTAKRSYHLASRPSTERCSSPPLLSCEQLDQPRGHGAQGQRQVDAARRRVGPRHPENHRSFLVLPDGPPACFADAAQPVHTVLAHAGQDEGQGGGPERPAHRVEQEVGGG